MRIWVGLTWIWDVPQAVRLYCSCGAAQARQWNIPNPSQPNQVREEMGHPVLLVNQVTCPPSPSCKQEQPIPNEQLFPVCGTDGNTYGSECELVTAACFERSGVRMAHIGPCNVTVAASRNDIKVGTDR